MFFASVQERSGNEQALKEALKRFKKEASPYDKVLVSGRLTRQSERARLALKMEGNVMWLQWHAPACPPDPQTKNLADLERLKESREAQIEENARAVDCKKDEFTKRIRLIDQQDAEARARLDVVTAPPFGFARFKAICMMRCDACSQCS